MSFPKEFINDEIIVIKIIFLNMILFKLNPFLLWNIIKIANQTHNEDTKVKTIVTLKPKISK